MDDRHNKISAHLSLSLEQAIIGVKPLKKIRIKMSIPNEALRKVLPSQRHSPRGSAHTVTARRRDRVAGYFGAARDRFREGCDLDQTAGYTHARAHRQRGQAIITRHQGLRGGGQNVGAAPLELFLQ